VLAGGRRSRQARGTPGNTAHGGDAELLHAELQGGALQPQAHRRAVRPGHDPLRVAGKMVIMWSSA
jgi:hypothetical protein